MTPQPINLTDVTWLRSPQDCQQHAVRTLTAKDGDPGTLAPLCTVSSDQLAPGGGPLCPDCLIRLGDGMADQSWRA